MMAEHFFIVASVLLQVIGLYLLADFVAGFFHWAEDTLGADDSPFWGPVFAAPNSVHHSDPAAMNRIHWLKNNAILFSFSATVVIATWLFGVFTWQVLVFAVFGGFTQQAHRFAHAPRVRLPKIIKALQKWYVLQDARHHWTHHTPPHLDHYCVMTPWLNPVLDRIGFWRALERILVPIFGAPRRPDLRGRNWFRETAVWAR